MTTRSIALQSAAEQVARPPEIEDPSNLHIVHPVSAALLRPAIRAGLHPNAVSLAGLAFGGAAAFAYFGWREPTLATAGLLLMLAWHVCDGLDGQLARATGKSSPLGRVLDGICDHATYTLVYVALYLSIAPLHGWLPTFLLAAVAGAAHAVQAAFFEGERESYIRRRNGIFHAAERHEVGGPFERLYNAAQRRLTDHARPVDRGLAGGSIVLTVYLRRTAPTIRMMTLLGANGRTLAIWIACLAGDPRLFWLWEIVVLGIVAVLLSRRLRNIESSLAKAAPPLSSNAVE